MSNQILSQVKNLSLDEKRDFLILLDELEEDGQKTKGQNVEDKQPLPNKKQGRTIDKVSEESDTSSLQ